MLKTFLAAAATAALMSVGACSQGPAEEAGEAADTATEEATTGTTDLGQGPAEEAGENVDAMTGATTTPADGGTTTPPATTP